MCVYCEMNDGSQAIASSQTGAGMRDGVRHGMGARANGKCVTSVTKSSLPIIVAPTRTAGSQGTSTNKNSHAGWL